MQRFEDADKIHTAFAKRYVAELTWALRGDRLGIF